MTFNTAFFDFLNQEINEKEGAFDLASFQPLEKRLLRVDLTLSSDTVEQFKEIYITVSNNNWNSVTTIGLFVANPILVIYSIAMYLI